MGPRCVLESKQHNDYETTRLGGALSKLIIFVFEKLVLKNLILTEFWLWELCGFLVDFWQILAIFNHHCQKLRKY